MIKTKKKNKVKPDAILKNFWRDNARFADLFNAILFDGENVIDPEELKEADTDLSAVLKFNGHADTLQKIMDVVKKSAYGVDFVILGLENQQHIHYGMPLRIMLGDTLGYVKEYQEIAKKNKTKGNWKGTEEFLSGFCKEDRAASDGHCLYILRRECVGRPGGIDRYAEYSQKAAFCGK